MFEGVEVMRGLWMIGRWLKMLQGRTSMYSSLESTDRCHTSPILHLLHPIPYPHPHPSSNPPPSPTPHHLLHL